MKKNETFNWHGYQVSKTEAWEVYQDMCDEVFGEDVVDIDSVDSNNAVLMHLMFVNQFEAFYEGLKAMLERLKEKMTSDENKKLLVRTVEEVADPLDGEEAYAQLVVWDKLWMLFEHGTVGLKDYAVGVIYDTQEDMNPYQLAEAHKHMVFEKFGDEIMDDDKHIVVLVKAPWNNKKCHEEDKADGIYYRSMARRTFIEHVDDDETELYDVADDYYGDALVKDAIGQLNGIVVIDMTYGDDNNQVVFHSFVNPNSKVMTKNDRLALLIAAMSGDGFGVLDTFEEDNY